MFRVRVRWASSFESFVDVDVVDVDVFVFGGS